MTGALQVADPSHPRVGSTDGAPVPATGAPSTPRLRPCKGCGRPIVRPARWCSTACFRDTEGPGDPEDLL